jgi:hypothetical protein
MRNCSWHSLSVACKSDGRKIYVGAPHLRDQIIPTQLHVSLLMCLQIPNFHSERSLHLDTIAVSSFINFPGRLHLNEGEASNSSMLREAPSFVFAWITHFVSRFWLGLFILAKILIWGQYQIGTPLFFHFRLKKCKWSYLHDFETNKWTLCLWFSTVLARISI